MVTWVLVTCLQKLQKYPNELWGWGRGACYFQQCLCSINGADSVTTCEFLTSVYQNGKIKKPFLQVLLQNLIIFLKINYIHSSKWVKIIVLYYRVRSMMF